MARTWLRIALAAAAVALALGLLSSISFESRFTPALFEATEEPSPEASPREEGLEAVPPASTSSEGAAARPQLLVRPAAGSWEATPLFRRTRALGRAGADLDAALQDLQPSISKCFSGESRVSPSRASAAAPGRGASDEARGVLLDLQVEARPQELRVVGSAVEVRSGASEAALACAREKLVGLRVPTPAAAPLRFRLRHRVAP